MAATSAARGGARRMAERIRVERRRAAQPPPAPPSLSSLRARIVREAPGLVLISKPPGLAVHGGPGVRHSVAAMLPELSRALFGRGAEPLRPCHRLDKDTSGALLLARSAEEAEQVQCALREHRMQRVYWALCVGVASPLDGIVDIPIAEKETPGPHKHYKMGLCPRFRVSPDGGVRRFRISQSAREAVTHYRTLDRGAGVSLLELQPITGVKHQLRAHLSLALNCPVLGDHKYSHWGRLAPQKLPPAALRALAIGAPETRHLPLHLHAAQIRLQLSPEAEPIVLQSPPPKYFLSTLRRLKIPLPDLKNIAFPGGGDTE
ncbi:pseudouridylate synthase RPUSD4, mitochondrial [Gastrophryne carolinensis]